MLARSGSMDAGEDEWGVAQVDLPGPGSLALYEQDDAFVLVDPHREVVDAIAGEVPHVDHFEGIAGVHAGDHLHCPAVVDRPDDVELGGKIGMSEDDVAAKARLLDC